MLHKTRYLKFDALQRWWPQSMEEVVKLLDQSPIVILWQCSESMAKECRRWIFRERTFHTPLVNLLQTEDELWQKLEAKSCRYEVRKGQKMEFVILRNQELDTAFKLINESITRQSYRPALTKDEWQRLLPTHDVFLCQSQGSPLVVHVLMRAEPDRIKLLLSGTADRSDPRFHKAIGPLNRMLHWHELVTYKAEGYKVYDFGGSPIDKNSPQYPITQFKVSFGAEIVNEPILFLAKNPLLRMFLGGVGWVQRVGRTIPWPKSWLAAIRSNPRFSFLRQ